MQAFEDGRAPFNGGLLAAMLQCLNLPLDIARRDFFRIIETHVEAGVGIDQPRKEGMTIKAPKRDVRIATNHVFLGASGNFAVRPKNHRLSGQTIGPGQGGRAYWIGREARS